MWLKSAQICSCTDPPQNPSLEIGSVYLKCSVHLPGTATNSGRTQHQPAANSGPHMAQRRHAWLLQGHVVPHHGCGLPQQHVLRRVRHDDPLPGPGAVRAVGAVDEQRDDRGQPCRRATGRPRYAHRARQSEAPVPDR
jgi:hypothetical protein